MNKRNFLKSMAGLVLVPTAVFAAASIDAKKLLAPIVTNVPDTSALDRANVRALMAHIKKQIRNSLDNNVFELNDKTTRNQIQNELNTKLDSLKSSRSIDDFVVVCDESNNTPDDIQGNKLNIDVAVRPNKSVPFIHVLAASRDNGIIEI